MPGDISDSAPPVSAPHPALAGVDAVLTQWLTTHLANSALSRNTEAWNVVVSAIPALRDALIVLVQS